MTAAEIDRMHARVRNWARYVRGSSNGGGCSCASAERNYTPPRPDEERLARHSYEPVDVVDAERMERAVCQLVYQMDRQFMRRLFVDRQSKAAVCRCLRLMPVQLDAFTHRVFALIHSNLQRQPDAVLIRKGRPIWAGVAR